MTEQDQSVHECENFAWLHEFYRFPSKTNPIYKIEINYLQILNRLVNYKIIML